MELTNLPRLDPVPVEYVDELDDTFKEWLSNLVDQINAGWQQIDNVLHVSQSNELGGTGVGPYVIALPDMNITPVSLATAVISKSSNIATVTVVTTGIDQISITFDVDPGAGSFVNYTILVAKP